MLKAIAICAISAVALAAQASAAAVTVDASITHHYDAFVAMNDTAILKDYTEDAILIIHDYGDAVSGKYVGHAEIQGAFQNLFKTRDNFSDFTAHDIREDLDASQPNVFLKWSNVGSGITQATDSFRFTAGAKIKVQTFVIWSAPGGGFVPAPGLTDAEMTTTAANPPGPTQLHWDNHLSAFGTGNMTKMKLDYNEKSVIRVWNTNDGIGTDGNANVRTFNGLAGVEEIFTEWFALAGMPENGCVAIPIIHVNEEERFVFLKVTWPCAGFSEWTDTFWFDEDGMILTQNIVHTYTKPTDAKADAKAKLVKLVEDSKAALNAAQEALDAKKKANPAMTYAAEEKNIATLQAAVNAAVDAASGAVTTTAATGLVAAAVALAVCVV